MKVPNLLFNHQDSGAVAVPSQEIALKTPAVSFIIRDMARHLMNVSVNVTATTFIFRGVARPLMKNRGDRN